jgi:hypothetical protein
LLAGSRIAGRLHSGNYRRLGADRWQKGTVEILNVGLPLFDGPQVLLIIFGGVNIYPQDTFAPPPAASDEEHRERLRTAYGHHGA